MKILYVTDALAIWGGMERILVEKANYLAEHYNFDVYIVTTEQGNHAVPYTLSSKVTHVDLGINYYQQYRYKGFRRLVKNYQNHCKYRSCLRQQIAKNCPDVIVIMRMNLVGDVIKVKRKIPIIVESHTSCNIYIYEKFQLYRKIQYLWYVHHTSKADAVIALTKGDAIEWSNRNSHVICIPNIVNLNTSGRYSAQESKSAIFVGRLAKQKDLGSLLQIWAIVNMKHPDWILEVYGEGEDEVFFRKRISEKKLNVVVHNPTSYIHDKYIESSFLLLTSLFEPFGLVMPEAMSCGLPVVAFDCPYGPSEIITDGIDGFLVKERDVTEFANKVCFLIEDKNQRIEMGKNAILSSHRYHEDMIMPKWKVLFENISKDSSR